MIEKWEDDSDDIIFEMKLQSSLNFLDIKIQKEATQMHTSFLHKDQADMDFCGQFKTYENFI